VAGLGRHRRQEVAHVRRDLALGDELPPVLLDRPLHPLAGHVLPGRDGDDPGVRLGLRRVDAHHLGPGVVAEPQRRVQHARDHHVVDVPMVAERQLVAPVARGARAHAPAAVDLGKGFPSLGGGRVLDGVDDLDVAGAPAEVARQAPGDLVPRR
jgi:hypothetical protein